MIAKLAHSDAHMPRSSYLFPFALNASPNGVSLPPPAAFSWHCPQAFPVCVANAAVAFAGPDVVKDVVATMKIMAAVPQTKTNTLLAFNFMVVSPLSVAARLSRRRLSNARRFHAIAYVSYGRCREELLPLQTCSRVCKPAAAPLLPQTPKGSQKKNPIIEIPPGRPLFVLRYSLVQGLLHRCPSRVHARLHVLPCRFIGRAPFL